MTLTDLTALSVLDLENFLFNFQVYIYLFLFVLIFAFHAITHWLVPKGADESVKVHPM